ncbi:hypothetical protein DSL72_007975 [Monilinia vaccinii-corymbosi]|uniref:Uncharacterized protein n=1 Tax=Monilinia vaccinii-corymbosi TaxID=61207 RepID=A0A8A3PJF9_9HELO|nr:hypothetical protein DSL72_007975 [Monilinia vaccinii-corymbosi]
MPINLPVERMLLSKRRNKNVECQVSVGYRIRTSRQRRGISSSSQASMLQRKNVESLSKVTVKMANRVGGNMRRNQFVLPLQIDKYRIWSPVVIGVDPAYPIITSELYEGRPALSFGSTPVPNAEVGSGSGSVSGSGPVSGSLSAQCEFNSQQADEMNDSIDPLDEEKGEMVVSDGDSLWGNAGHGNI